MDKVYAIQLFIRVANLESFSRAAETLALPKGSVLRQIQAPESHLGVWLLHRTTRRVQLTQDGMIYYERAKDLLSNLDELDGTSQHDPASTSGRLRVDMSVGFAKKLMIPHLPTFLQQYPSIELELSSSDRLMDVIHEGLGCMVRIGALKDSGLIARPPGKLMQTNCASPDYLARSGYPQSSEDLADYTLVHYASTLGVRPSGFEVVTDGMVRWIKISGILTVNGVETYQVACIVGSRIIQVSRIGAHEMLCTGDLTEILPQCCAGSLPISPIHPRRRNLSCRVHLLMKWPGGLMKDYVDRSPWMVSRQQVDAFLQDTSFKVYFLLNLVVKKEEIAYDVGKRQPTSTTGTGHAAEEK